MSALASPLGRMIGRASITEDEMRLMKGAAWHQQGVIVIHPDDTDITEFEKAFANGIGKRRHGPRT